MGTAPTSTTRHPLLPARPTTRSLGPSPRAAERLVMPRARHPSPAPDPPPTEHHAH